MATRTDVVEGPFHINIEVSAEHTAEAIHATIQQAVISYSQATNPQPYMTAPEPEFDEFGSPRYMLTTQGVWDIHNPSRELSMNTAVQPMTLLSMRMGWGGYKGTRVFGEANNPPFDHISIHRNDTTVFVFVVTDKKPITIEDDVSMFPSDSLVTRLRMLIDK
jgi:hypothetical protein